VARIRTVKPEYWEDEKVGSLSRDARLLFIASWNQADDEGLLRWAPQLLRRCAFAYDDDLTIADVTGLMDEIVKSGMVFMYRAGSPSQALAYVVNFRKHQKINRPGPGKLSPPSLQNPDVRVMYGQRDGFVCYLCGHPIPPWGETKVRSPRSGEIVDISCITLSVDHVVPRALGGSDYPSNVRAVHLGCNSGRGKRDAGTFTTPARVARTLSEMALDSVSPHGTFTDDSLRSHGVDEGSADAEVGGGSGRSTEDSLNPHGGRIEPALGEGKGREQGKEKEGETNSPTASILFAVPAVEPSPKPNAYPQAFEDAWVAYGRKGAKKTAYGEWQRAIKRAPVAVIVAAIPAIVAATPDPQFRKDFERWLKGDCWESAVVARKPANGYRPFANPTDPNAYHEELKA
jgi:hypothetical protein